MFPEEFSPPITSYSWKLKHKRLYRRACEQDLPEAPLADAASVAKRRSNSDREGWTEKLLAVVQA